MMKLLILLFSFLPIAAAQDSADISVKAEVDRAFMTIGDPVTYRVEIRHKPEIKILSRVPSPDKDILKIRKIREINEETADGMRIQGREFEVTTFKLGEYVLDPVIIEYQNPDGTSGALSTDKIYITVESISKGEEKKDIRGVKSVLTLEEKIMSMLLFALIGIGLIVLLLILRNFLAKRKNAADAKPALSAEEEALLNLNALFDSDLLRRDKTKEYYLKLSEILRTYLERRYQIPAIESTTVELMRLMKRQNTSVELNEKINQVLEAADLAKFAKWKPPANETMELNRKSKAIIEEARPKPEVSEGEPEASSHGV